MKLDFDSFWINRENKAAAKEYKLTLMLETFLLYQQYKAVALLQLKSLIAKTKGKLK